MMESGTKFTFTCNDVPERSFHFFEDMRQKKEFCDISFRIGNDIVHAHRIIITAAIPFLRGILSNRERQGEEEGITLPNIDPEVFKNIISYSYNYKLEIDINNAISILSAACYLHMDDVKEACCDFLVENLDFGSLLHVREIARKLNCLELLTSIDCHVRQNFYEIVETEQFLNWPISYLKDVIGGNDLYVDSEQTLLEAAIKWVKVCPEERKDELPGLLRKIRLQEVDPLCLVDIVEAEEFIRVSPPIRDLIDEAKHYNFLPRRRIAISSFPTEPRRSTKSAPENVEEDNLRICKLHVQPKHSLQSFKSAEEEEEWKLEADSAFYATGGSTAATRNQMFYFYWGDALQYDLVKNSWEYLNNVPVPSMYMGAVALKEKICVVGGKLDDLTASSAVRCYDPETMEWTLVKPMRNARWAASAVALSGYIFVLGGRNEARVFNSVERYDPEMDKWKSMRPMLTGRYHAGAASVNGRIYVCGGTTRATETGCIATAEMYDPMKNRWTLIKPMNSARCEFTLLSYRSKLYAIGGEDNDGILQHKFLIYDPQSDEWATGPSTDPDNEVSGAVTMSVVSD